MRSPLICSVLLLCSASVDAVTIAPLTSLPTEIYDCFQNNQCTSAGLAGSNIVTPTDADGVAAFHYTQLGVEKWLLRYDLLVPPGTVSGTAWLSAQNSYDIVASDAHSFTLYYDNPTPTSIPSPPFALRMTDADLSDGSAYRRSVLDFTAPGGVAESGSLDVTIAPCLAEGCGAEVHFDLLHMQYVDGLFSFLSQDSRGRLFEQRYWNDCSYPGCDSYAYTQSLYVHAVPLPASMLLLISGLVCGMVGMPRRRLRSKD